MGGDTNLIDKIFITDRRNVMPKSVLHPLLKGRNQLEFQRKIQTSMDSSDIDFLIILKPENVFYATGYYPSAIGLSIATISLDGDVKLIVSELDGEVANSLTSEHVEVKEYPTWVYLDDGTKDSL